MTSLSIVLPLYNAERFLPSVLPPLLAAVESGEALELIVVDDGSTDGGPEYCRTQGARMISSGGKQLGPGAARNRGVDEAKGDVVLFVDSDVVIDAGVPARVQAAFASDPNVVAVFGSYDDRPRDSGLVSQYLNLRHHLVHQHGDANASTFWAGCGAVSRERYLGVGGFDQERFPRPMIEDIELGYRMRADGKKICLDRTMLCTHLKRWTLRSMVMTDVFGRALPWTRLMILEGDGEQNLNVSPAERWKAMLSGVITLGLLGGYLHSAAFVVAALALVAAFVVNRELFLLIRRRNGVLHMAAGVLLHQLYYHYSVLSFAFCQLEARVRSAPARAASTASR